MGVNFANFPIVPVLASAPTAIAGGLYANSTSKRLLRGNTSGTVWVPISDDFNSGTSADPTAVSTTETIVSQVAIPANYIGQGSCFRMSLWGNTAASGNPTGRLRFGTLGTTSDTALISPTATSTLAANIFFQGMFQVHSATSSSATYRSQWSTQIGTTLSVGGVNAGTINLTVTNFITLTMQMSASTVNVRAATIEQVV